MLAALAGGAQRGSLCERRRALDREEGQSDFFHDDSTTNSTYHPKLEGLDLSKSSKNIPQLESSPENRHVQHSEIPAPKCTGDSGTQDTELTRSPRHNAQAVCTPQIGARVYHPQTAPERNCHRTNCNGHGGTSAATARGASAGFTARRGSPAPHSAQPRREC